MLINFLTNAHIIHRHGQQLIILLNNPMTGYQQYAVISPDKDCWYQLTWLGIPNQRIPKRVDCWAWIQPSQTGFTLYLSGNGQQCIGHSTDDEPIEHWYNPKTQRSCLIMPYGNTYRLSEYSMDTPVMSLPMNRVSEKWSIRFATLPIFG